MDFLSEINVDDDDCNGYMTTIWFMVRHWLHLHTADMARPHLGRFVLHSINSSETTILFIIGKITSEINRNSLKMNTGQIETRSERTKYRP